MRKTILSPYRAQYSLDAAFAFLICLMCIAGFLSLFSEASSFASRAAEEESNGSEALRLSVLALAMLEERGEGIQAVPYYESNVIDPGRLSSFEASWLAEASGKGFASFEVETSGGELFSGSFGERAASAYCASRLALYKGKPAALKVCIS